MNFLTDIKVLPVEAATGAGQTTIESAVVDTKGYEGVVFLVAAGTIDSSAVTKLKVQQGEQAGGGDMADLVGTGVTIAADDDGQSFAVEVHKPRERYVRAVITRATADSAFGVITAFLYGGDGPQNNNVTDVITSEIHLSPAEGTA